MCCNRSSGARLGSLPQIYQVHHEDESPAEQRVGIYISQHVGLANEIAIKQSLRLEARKCGTGTLRHLHVLRALRSGAVGGIVWGEVGDKNGLMYLGSAGQERGHIGAPRAAAGIPRKINDGRGVFDLLFGGPRRFTSSPDSCDCLRTSRPLRKPVCPRLAASHRTLEMTSCPLLPTSPERSGESAPRTKGQNFLFRWRP